MKKNLIIGAVLLVLSFSNAAAQDSVTVKKPVKESFERNFQGASKVRFETFKGIYRVKFDYLGGHWLAFFDPAGTLITKGRLVPSNDHLPIAVQTGLYDAKRRAEQKYGAINVGRIYEMTKQGVTEYFVSMENTSIALSYVISQSGYATVHGKQKRDQDAKSSKGVLARKGN
jgi:hypothetical protein